MPDDLKWKKYYPLSDKNAFICLVDSMGDDSSIVQAARVSFGKDEQKPEHIPDLANPTDYVSEEDMPAAIEFERKRDEKKDRQLIRYLMNHEHGTPFEMVELKFMVQVPMDCWRQWIRHRTANVNEYSTRYTEALDLFQVTEPTEWRLQVTDNKQGSSGYLEEWPERWKTSEPNIYHPPQHPIDAKRSRCQTPGQYLTSMEETFHEHAKALYQERLDAGIAKEQARKDLPLSTYTRAYWKCDLRNIFNFLRLRMDSHAQLEIRSFANCMFEIVKQICPVACEAFEDYVLHAKKFSRMEMEILHKLIHYRAEYSLGGEQTPFKVEKSTSMTNREWKEFLEKLS